MIIRQSELGVYDTARVSVAMACAGWVRLATGEYFKLKDNEQLIECTNWNRIVDESIRETDSVFLERSKKDLNEIEQLIEGAK
jgi:hypothetical protein